MSKKMVGERSAARDVREKGNSVSSNDSASLSEGDASDCEIDARVKRACVSASDAPAKKKKRGIIYLSTIPKYMNVTRIREIMSGHGKVGRVYLQLAETEADSTRKKKKRKVAAKHFTEGWVEFESKRVAKRVAEILNNTQISTRKKSQFYDIIWNIKYLPRFKWIHLSERLAYERAVHKQRLNAEIAQAKREVNFFSHNVDRSKKLRRKEEAGEPTSFVAPDIRQRDTDAEIRSRKKNGEEEDRTTFLKSLFA